MAAAAAAVSENSARWNMDEDGESQQQRRGRTANARALVDTADDTAA